MCPCQQQNARMAWNRKRSVQPLNAFGITTQNDVIVKFDPGSAILLGAVVFVSGLLIKHI